MDKNYTVWDDGLVADQDDDEDDDDDDAKKTTTTEKPSKFHHGH